MSRSLEVDLEHALLAVDRTAVERLLSEVPRDDAFLPTVERAVSASLERLGLLWEKGEASLSQIYMGGRICEQVLKTLLGEGPRQAGGPRVGVAVLKDHHTLGITLVAISLRARGFAFEDYGHGNDPVELAERVHQEGVEVLFVSCLLLNAAVRVRELVEALRERGSTCRVIVGGAPFRLDRELWREVGAHATAPDAFLAPALLQEILRPA